MITTWTIMFIAQTIVVHIPHDKIKKIYRNVNERSVFETVGIKLTKNFIRKNGNVAPWGTGGRREAKLNLG